MEFGGALILIGLVLMGLFLPALRRKGRPVATTAEALRDLTEATREFENALRTTAGLETRS